MDQAGLRLRNRTNAAAGRVLVGFAWRIGSRPVPKAIRLLIPSPFGSARSAASPVLLVVPKWAKRHFDSLSCTLTEKSLCLKKGVWFRTEKTIPLEKITDLSLTEGPILRYFGLCSLKIETAGQSAQPGAANADMTGVVNALAFRDLVLTQRDELEEKKMRAKRSCLTYTFLELQIT